MKKRRMSRSGRPCGLRTRGRRFSSTLNSCLVLLPRVSFSLFLLLMPLAYDTRDGDSTGVRVGLGAAGGKGQFATVFRGCNGEVLEAYENNYTDYAGGAELLVPVDSTARFVFGVRAGHFHVDAPARLTRYYGYSESLSYELGFDYVNPYFGIERARFGIGLGYMTGHVPFSVKDLQPGYSEMHVTGHLRFGNRENRAYFLLSLGENMPLVSGGGLFTTGIGYPIGRDVEMLTGLSLGYYDHGGLVQQAHFRLYQGVHIECSGRVGESQGIFEGSFSAGLIWQIGLGQGRHQSESIPRNRHRRPAG